MIRGMNEEKKPLSSNSSLSTSSSNSGNATGTGRTKVALKPGFGLMGWINYSSKAKDLSGVDAEHRNKNITMEELKKHNQPNDCWISIRGKVFNVTSYIDYHPGGEDELMKGAGKNATQLFEDVHSWVNYESLLQKCYVGKLAGYDLS